MKTLLTFLAILITFYILPTTVLAQSANTQADGIEVNPSIVQLDLENDKPQTTLTYTNHTTQTVMLNFSASDVTELEDSYKISFLDQKNAQNFKYGLSSWVEFSNSSLLLNPGKKGTITIFIDKDKLSPGGHYGSALAQIIQTNSQGNVTIKGILATLLFVRTHTGHEYEKGTITTFAPERQAFDFPQNFLLRFTNSGDTYLIPYGRVAINDMWGNFVGKAILNSGSLLVLPESLRRMEIPTELFGGILWPGIYHATLSMHFGKTNQSRTVTATFFSFGTLPIMQILIGVITVLGIIYVVRRRH